MVSSSSLFGHESAVLHDSNFQLLLLANLIPALGIALLSPMLDSLVEPFGTSTANIGLVISVFTAPAIVMIPVAGVLADRFGRKPILVSSLVLFGLAGSAIAFTTDFRVVIALRLLQGVAFGGLTPILITSIGDFYSGSVETTAQGLRFTGSGLSQTMFPLLAGLLVTLGWQYPFFLYATALPVAIALFFWFDEPAGHRTVTADGGGRPHSDEGGRLRSELLAVVRLLQHRHILVLTVARGLPVVVWITFLTYNSIIVVHFTGGTPGQAGVLVAVGSFCYAGAASQAGRLSAYFESYLGPLFAANCLLLVGFALLLTVPSFPVAVGGVTLAGIGFGIALSLYRSIITGVVPVHLRARTVGLAEANGRLVATLTPIIAGLVIATFEPVLGFTRTVQVTGLGAALLSSVGGVLCLLLTSDAHLRAGD